MGRKDAMLVTLVAAIAGLWLVATPVRAGYSLYDDGRTKVVFNLDVAGAGFGNANSWFGKSGSFLGENTDAWFEFGAEPRVSFETPLGTRGVVFGQLSGVYTNTLDDDASGLTVGRKDTEEMTLEQAHLGYRLDDPFSGLEDDSFSIILGRQDYTIGTGLLITDGGGDGGDRGGWWLGLRKSFQESVMVRLKSKTLLAEAFRLENNARDGQTEGEAYGANLEYTFAERLTLGTTYFAVEPDLPDADRLNVVSGRLDWRPIDDLAVGGEYVHQTNDQIEANGWYGQIGYTMRPLPWTPTLSYRHARFGGDDPGSSDDEGFREIAYGFTDYGTWYQGEITGNYPLGNSNLISHLLRLKAQPCEALTLNLLYYDFTLDEPGALAPSVTSDEWGDEINVALDWQATEQIYVVGVLGALVPGRAAEQLTGGNETWLYSMLYASYSW